MLSRVADSLYWMSRYLERAEHTARLLNVNLNMMLDQSRDQSGRRWERMLSTLRVDPVRVKSSDAYGVTQALTADMANDASIVTAVGRARENARQVREQISSEMWEQINRLYLEVSRTRMDSLWNEGPHRFYTAVEQGVHLFQGITDATMSHGEGWQFIQIGRSIERAQATAILLDVQFSTPQEADPHDTTHDYIELVGVLKSCTAFEAFCKVAGPNLTAERIVEYLLLNADFPRSVRFSADAVQAGLQAVGRSTGLRSAGRAERLAGRLRAALDYGQVDEIMPDMHGYMENIQRQCTQLHAAIQQIYIAYPIETALAS